MRATDSIFACVCRILYLEHLLFYEHFPLIVLANLLNRLLAERLWIFTLVLHPQLI